MDPFFFLAALNSGSLLLLFWWMALIEMPRIAIGAIVVPAVTLWPSRPSRQPSDLTVSVVLVGHNEEKSLRTCVESFAEQTIVHRNGSMQIVVVDDGSTDRMGELALRLRGEGKVEHVLRAQRRSGKSAGINLALSVCRGDIIIISDIDTTLDRDAVAKLVCYFSDPRVGAVSGNIGVRNVAASLMTRFQAIEYSIGLSLGRSIVDTLGTVTIISGALGAFRRVALDGVGRLDTQVGEDADLTMKLRRAGWRLRFAADARGLTDVPETPSRFIAQRLRWDRGLITIWVRKFREVIDPRQADYRLVDALAVMDVIFYQVGLAIAFPVYLVWLFYHFASFGATILAATLIGYSMLDFLAFAAAASVGVRMPAWLIAYVPLYTILQLTLGRFVRLAAIMQEFMFRSSYRDPYVPRHVMSQVEVR